ncbi:MAG TPA: MAPEG family protein [Steroidobacteraceae bacterium]|jgi:glutathione S-transferase|nr:MAPEG family protein [Steroidobacteraceae bacterium]
MIPATLWTAIVTLLIGFFYFYTAFRVGNLRGKHGIRAPATSGHPEFDRAYRVQLNTLEQMGIFLPFLWVAAFYPIGWAWLAPLIGFVWLIGRILYLRGYMADPNKRLIGAMTGGVTSMIMLIIAVTGVVQACLALRVM